MLIDNLRNDIYPDIKQYLIGENDPNEERFIKLETLNKFRVGVGEEKFYSEKDSKFIPMPSVYFPMFAPLSEK